MVIEAVMQTEEREREVDWESSHVEGKDLVVARSIALEEEKDIEVMLTIHALELTSALAFNVSIMMVDIERVYVRDGLHLGRQAPVGYILYKDR